MRVTAPRESGPGGRAQTQRLTGPGRRAGLHSAHALPSRSWNDAAPTGATRSSSRPSRPATRRRSAARARVALVAPAGGADLRARAGRRRGGRAGDVAARARRARPLRGPLVAEDLGVPDPRQHGARPARSARGARCRSRRSGPGRVPEAAVTPTASCPTTTRAPGRWSSPPRDLPEERCSPPRRVT